MRWFAIPVLVGLIFAARPGAAQTPETDVRAALAHWTDNFNSARADKVCDLFSFNLRADVRGAAERDYDTQCSLLRKALADPDHSYNYAFDVKEILHRLDDEDDRQGQRAGIDQPGSGAGHLRPRARRTVAHHSLHRLRTAVGEKPSPALWGKSLSIGEEGRPTSPQPSPP